MAVLEWCAWDGFLLNYVLGDDVLRIETDPFRDLPDAQFEQVCRSSSSVCFQINLSVRRHLPLRIRDLTCRFAERGIHVVNGYVQDIRKSVLQSHLETLGLASPRAGSTGAPDEILFVKSNLNYGGALEKSLPPDLAVAAGFADLISPDIGPYGYRTVIREQLPDSVWTDPTIVVEKFITNSENSFYRVYFSGKQVIIVKAFARGDIKKLSNDPRDTNYVSELDFLKDGSDGLGVSPKLKRDVAQFVENTPVDFGCIDIVHDGRDHHYIVDLNLTPYAGMGATDPWLNEFLRAGITCPPQRKPAVSIRTPLG